MILQISWLSRWLTFSTNHWEHQQYPVTGRQQMLYQYLKEKGKNINPQITGQSCSHAYAAK